MSYYLFLIYKKNQTKPLRLRLVLGMYAVEGICELGKIPAFFTGVTGQSSQRDDNHSRDWLQANMINTFHKNSYTGHNFHWKIMKMFVQEGIIAWSFLFD